MAAGRKLETSAGGATDDCKTSSRLQEEAIVSDIFTVTEDDELSGSRLDSPLVMCRVSLCETSSSKSLEKNLDSRFSEHDEVDSDADYEMAMDDMPSSPTKIASPGSMLSAVEPGGGGLVQ